MTGVLVVSSALVSNNNMLIMGRHGGVQINVVADALCLMLMPYGKICVIMRRCEYYLKSAFHNVKT